MRLRAGDVEVIVICDGAADYHSDITVAYPAVPDGAWADVRDRYPGAFAASGTWRLHLHAAVVSSPGGVVLVDTGVGAPWAPAFGWFGAPGALLPGLAAAGIAPEDVDAVVLTHVHDDHVGGTTNEDGSPAFPRARYVVHAADLAWLRVSGDPQDEAIDRRLLTPLQEAGVLEVVDGETMVGDALRVIPAPGHTPGHQVAWVQAREASLLLWGDIANHPGQVEHPEWPSGSDVDPARAVATRGAILRAATELGLLVGPAHFPEPFGRIAAGDGARRWEPLRA